MWNSLVLCIVVINSRLIETKKYIGDTDAALKIIQTPAARPLTTLLTPPPSPVFTAGSSRHSSVSLWIRVSGISQETHSSEGLEGWQRDTPLVPLLHSPQSTSAPIEKRENERGRCRRSDTETEGISAGRKRK